MEEEGISSVVGTPGSPLNAMNAINGTEEIRRQLAVRPPTMNEFLFGENLSTAENMRVHRESELTDPIFTIFKAAGIRATKNLDNTYTITMPPNKHVRIIYSNSIKQSTLSKVNEKTATIPGAANGMPITSVEVTDVERSVGNNTAASSLIRPDQSGGARKTKSKPKKRNGTKHNRTKMGRLSARVIRRLDLRRSHRRSKPATTTTQRRTQRRRKSNQ